MKKTSIAGLVGLLFTTPIFAATVQADDVVVTASRVHDNIQNIAANIQIITRKDIKEINSVSIPQILNQLGGLTIRGNSLGQFSLGATVDMGAYGEAATSNTLVLINGQRVNPIDSSSIAWEMIPVEAIERIEITRGGAGVQYGNRAVGGAINIVTNESAQNINRASASYGSFNTQTLSALLQNKFNDTLVKVSANTEHTNGWRENSAATAYAANASVTQFFDESSVYLDISGSQNYSKSPGGVVGLVGQGDRQQAKFNNVGSFFKGENYGITLGNFWQINSNAVLETDMAYKKSNLTYEEPYNNIRNLYDRWSITFSPRLKIDFNTLGSLVMGYDFSHAYGSDNKESNAKLIDNSVYAMYRLPLVGALDLNTAYRRQIEHATANDQPANHMPTGEKTTSANAWDVGLNYKLSTTEKIYVKYNQSFRFPNIDEFWGLDANWNRVFKGAILDPQNDRTYQVGGDFLVGTTKITASFYHTDTSNQIRYDTFADANINDPYRIERKGIYLSTSSKISDGLAIYTNSNLQDVAYAEGPNKNQSVALAPHFTINGRINYKIDESWSIGAIVNHVGAQYYAGAHDLYNNRIDTYYPQYSIANSISDFYKKIPSYSVADIYANYRIGHWETRVTVKNLTNKHYSTYGGMGFVTLPNGSDWSYYYYPSDPRSVFASVSYNF
jgi:iron complex outermembrane receptor protein